MDPTAEDLEEAPVEAVEAQEEVASAEAEVIMGAEVPAEAASADRGTDRRTDRTDREVLADPFSVADGSTDRITVEADALADFWECLSRRS